jgi:hypothetical protein
VNANELAELSASITGAGPYVDPQQPLLVYAAFVSAIGERTRCFSLLEVSRCGIACPQDLFTADGEQV